MISALILTKNEERDLPSCLKTLSWCDDVHVFDSYSEDNTVEIAKSLGATVTQRKFDGYSAQRNAALRTLKYKHSWLLILDADERVPAELVQKMIDAISKAGEQVDGFRMQRRDYLNHTWLKHAQMTSRYVRLVRIAKAHYHREINEVLEVQGDVMDIDGYFEHYPFSKGFTHWLQKHNVYSTMEAQRWMQEHNGDVKFSFRKALLGKDLTERRYHQKGIFYKIPGRPVIKWIYLMFFKRSFLDGRAGVTVATLQAIYEYFIVVKTRELLTQKKQSSGSLSLAKKESALINKSTEIQATLPSKALQIDKV